MEERSVHHSTFTIERKYAAAPERVFAAFADPATKRRWFGVEQLEMDFRVGGRERATERLPEGTPFPGATLTNDTTYLDIVPNRRVVIGYTMTLGDHRMSASLGTFEFVPVEAGTVLIFTDQGAYFERSDGPAMRRDGWGVLLDGLEGEVAR